MIEFLDIRLDRFAHRIKFKNTEINIDQFGRNNLN